MLKEPDIYPYLVTDLSRRDALCIAPHPDDESLGCGGSIAKHMKSGSRMKVIFLTDGDKGDFEGRYGDKYGAMRRKSAGNAMSILGVKDFEFWSYKDRELHLSIHEIQERLLDAIRAFSPSLIYAPSPMEAHPDHKTAFRAVWELRGRVSISLVFYEVLMALYPNILVDISGQFKQKKKAIKGYFTEVYYNDYIAKIEGLNRFRTTTLPKDIKYAEAFVLLEDGTQFADSFPVRLLKQTFQDLPFSDQ
jgi:LmbE family N-acetylglucosaminyl deacetylase